MDQLIRATLSLTHYWYEVDMLKVPAVRIKLKKKNCRVSPFASDFFLFLWRCRFFRVFLYHYRSLFVSRVLLPLYVFPFQMVLFHLVTTGWIFYFWHHQLIMCVCVCVCVFFPFILDIKFVGRTSRGHTGGRSHRISHPPSFCGACLNFSREKDSVIPFPRRP